MRVFFGYILVSIPLAMLIFYGVMTAGPAILIPLIMVASFIIGIFLLDSRSA